MSSRADTRTSVLVFAREPRAGQVKTRLIPRLGAEGAARLHARLVQRALATARAARLGPVELWGSRCQRGADLGARRAGSRAEWTPCWRPRRTAGTR